MRTTIGKYNKFAVISTLTWATSSPILFIFLMSKGLSIGEAGLFFAVSSFVTLLGEIPTGAFADAYGRKTSIGISFPLTIIGMLAIIFGTGREVIYLGAVLTGVANAFMSGAIDAWAVDRLVLKNEGMRSINLFASGFRFMSIALFFGAIIGGIVGEFSMELAIAMGIPFALYGIYFASKLEEKLPRKSFARAFDGIMHNTLQAFKLCISNKRLLSLIAITLLIGMAVYPLFAFWQPAFAELFGWGPFEFGFLFAGFSLFAIAGSVVGEKIGHRKYAMGIALALSALFITLGAVAWAAFLTLALYLAMQLFRGVRRPIENKILHNYAKNRQRATTASIRNMAFSLGVGMMGLGLFLAGKVQIPESWIVSGIIMAVAAGIAFWNKF